MQVLGGILQKQVVLRYMAIQEWRCNLLANGVVPTPLLKELTVAGSTPSVNLSGKDTSEIISHFQLL